MPDLMTLLTPSLAAGLIAWFAETTLVAAALAGLALIVDRAPRLAPGPAARHLLWVLVLLKLMTPPLIHWPWSRPSPVAIAAAEPERDAARPDHPAEARRFDFTRAFGAGQTRRDRGDGGPAAAPFRPAIGAPVAAPAAPPPRVDIDAPTPGGPAVDWRLALAGLWLAGSITLGGSRAGQILRFRRRLTGAGVQAGPAWLVAEADRVGRLMGVRVPAIRVLPGLGSPILWCLGRPVLLVPAPLVASLEVGRWRSIVAHELAHLRRGDHWVRRLELLAALVWWWNPLYWLARSRVDFEAELACDAWAVWAAPGDRITYAESLIRIGTNLSLSPARTPAPALGVAGSGRSFERRLTMILSQRVDRRISVPSFLAASLLAAVALPSWTRAEIARAYDPPAPADPVAEARPTNLEVAAPVVAVFTADDDDDDDDRKAEQAKLRKKLEVLDKESKSAEKGKKGKARAEDDKTGDADKKADADADKKGDARKAPMSQELEYKMKADRLQAEQVKLQKRLEALGRELAAKTKAREVTSKVEQEKVEKRMEAMGKEMEAKFGPNSDFAKNIEKNFGPDSEFTKNIEKNFGENSEFVKNIEKNFGENSEFVKNIEKNFGENSDFARNMARSMAAASGAEVKPSDASATKDNAKTIRGKARADAARAKQRATTQEGGPSKKPTKDRARRIDQIQAQIDKLTAELKQLKTDDDDDDQDDDGK